MNPEGVVGVYKDVCGCKATEQRGLDNRYPVFVKPFSETIILRPEYWKEYGDDKQKLNLEFPVTEDGSHIIRFVTARTPDSGTMICELDGKVMKLGDREEYDLSIPFRTLSKAVSGPQVKLSKGTHVLTIRKGPNSSEDSMLGLDFLWLKKI